MKSYKLTMEDIDTASNNGIVVCWCESLNCPVAEVNIRSSEVFADKEVVEIPDQTRSDRSAD